MSPAINLSAPDQRPRWKAFFARLWPWQASICPDLPPWAKDAIYCENRVELSMPDRLRVLISGRIRVRSCTFTETAPGRVETISQAHPLSPVSLE